MINDSLNQLIDGYQKFRESYVAPRNADYRKQLAKSQTPKIMIISCCDSRTNPAILTHACLGEIFTLSNIANLVPPYMKGNGIHYSTCSALEYAINHLKVEHVIVMGHSQCGGIRALMAKKTNSAAETGSIIDLWIDIAHKAKTRTLLNYPNCTLEEQCSRCEREALLVSLENLQTFPWIKSALSQGSLALHLWHFNIESGDIDRYSQRAERFVPLLSNNV